MGAAKRARRAEAIRRRELEKLPSAMFNGTAYRGANLPSETFTMPMMVILENERKDQGTSMPQAINTIVAKLHVIESSSQASSIQLPVAKEQGISLNPTFDPMNLNSINFAPSISESRLPKSRRVCSRVGFPPKPSVITQRYNFQVPTAAMFSIDNDGLAHSLRVQAKAIVSSTTPIGILHLPNRAKSACSLSPDTVSRIVAKFVKPIQSPLPQRSTRPRNVTYDMTLHRAATWFREPKIKSFNFDMTLYRTTKWFLEPKDKKSGFDMTLHRVVSWFREPKVNVANCDMTLYRARKWFLEPKTSTCNMSFDVTADWFTEDHEQLNSKLEMVQVTIMDGVKEPSLDVVNQPIYLPNTAESGQLSQKDAVETWTMDVTPLSKTAEQLKIELDCAKPQQLLVSHGQGEIVPSKDVARKTTEAAFAKTQDSIVPIPPTTPSTKDRTVLLSENVSKSENSTTQSADKKIETLNYQKPVPAWVRLSAPVARRSVSTKAEFVAKPIMNKSVKPAFRVPGINYRPVDTNKLSYQSAIHTVGREDEPFTPKRAPAKEYSEQKSPVTAIRVSRYRHTDRLKGSRLPSDQVVCEKSSYSPILRLSTAAPRTVVPPLVTSMCTAEALPKMGSLSGKAEPMEPKVLGKAESLLTHVISQKLAPVKSKDNTQSDISEYINGAEKTPTPIRRHGRLPIQTQSDNNAISNRLALPTHHRVVSMSGITFATSIDPAMALHFQLENTFVGTISANRFLKALDKDSKGYTTKATVAKAFITLAAKEHTRIIAQGFISTGVTIVTADMTEQWSDIILQQKIKLGTVSLWDFLAKIDFWGDDSVSDVEVIRAFNEVIRAFNEAATEELEDDKIAESGNSPGFTGRWLQMHTGVGNRFKAGADKLYNVYQHREVRI